MKLKNTYDANALFHSTSYGPTFGGGGNQHDLRVGDLYVYLKLGNTYESGPPLKLTDSGGQSIGCANLTIKEMEVYEVSGTSSRAKVTIATELKTPTETPNVDSVTIFSDVTKLHNHAKTTKNILDCFLLFVCLCNAMLW